MDDKNSTIKGYILYLIVTFVSIAGVAVFLKATEPPPAPKAMDKASMFEIVSANAAAIRADIEADDFTNTLSLLASSRDTPEVTREGDCVFVYCYGWGFASTARHTGFYYVPWDGPAEIGGIMPPYAKYFSVQGPDLIDHLEPDGPGWKWSEPDSDNMYYTEKICDCFWYYELEY